MTKNSDIDPADKDLFRQMVGEVQPVKQDHADIQSPKPSARAKQQEADDRQVLVDMLSDHHGHLETGDELSYHQDGIQKTVLRKLRRGQYRIEAEVDLHGYNSDGARKELINFIAYAQNHNYRCIRIIHGKGNNYAKGPVLKPLVNSWLRQKSEILAFCSARPQDGGTGAVYALLKGAKPS